MTLGLRFRKDAKLIDRVLVRPSAPRQVKRRLQEGGLQVQPVIDMWEALAALVFPPKGT